MPVNQADANSRDSSRCGYVAIIGAPNAGKSTLTNKIVGEKVSIVTAKVQTTRSRFLGLAIVGSCQLILVDTPGIFSPQKRLDKAMVDAAWNSVADADAILLLVDAAKPRSQDVTAIIDGLNERGMQAVFALNKVDLVEKTKLPGLAADYLAQGRFSRSFMISGKTGGGVRDLVQYLSQIMPAGAWLYPADQLADVPMRMMAAEITREQLFTNLHKELPYQITVETEKWQQQKDGDLRIDQVIYVRRDSQRAIILGKQGQAIRRIGQAARIAMTTAFARRVHLFLHVKVRDKWMEDPERYREMGLDFPDKL